MKVRCYTLVSVTDMLDIGLPNKIKEFENFLKLLVENDVQIFTPDRAPGSGRARKQILTYLRSNEWLDKYIKQHNIIATLMNRKICKPTYRELPIPKSFDIECFTFGTHSNVEPFSH